MWWLDVEFLHSPLSAQTLALPWLVSSSLTLPPMLMRLCMTYHRVGSVVPGPGEFPGLVRVAMVSALVAGPAPVPAHRCPESGLENLEFDWQMPNGSQAAFHCQAQEQAQRPNWETVRVVKRHREVEISLDVRERRH